jgi:hypothetical protein
MNDLLREGRLSSLLNLVQRDRDLLLEIRDNELNIYFKGNSLLKLCKRGTGYEARHSEKFGLKGINEYYIESKEDCVRFTAMIPQIKHNISLHSAYANEIECEQLLIRFNNNECLDSDYIIIDRQVAKHNWKGRMDLIGLYWPHEGRSRNRTVDLAIMEMKFGQNPDISDIKDQIESYYDHLKDHFDEIKEEARILLLQKLDLSLINGSDEQLKAMRNFQFSDNLETAHIVILFVDYKPHSHLFDISRLRNIQCFNQIRIFNVGFGLWDKNKLILEK